MRIERQVERKQIHVVLQQQAKTSAPRAGNARIFAAPEVAVMHEQSIGAALNCGLNERAGSSDARHDCADFGAPFHLQSVWAIITKTGDFEILIKISLELGALHGWIQPVSPARIL